MPRGSLTDVTILMTIADQLSFRAAASRLGVTASALSNSKPDLRHATASAAVIAPVWQRSAYPGVHPELQVSEENVDMVAKSFDAGIGPHGGGGHD
jgi:DNA-binding transcriptional LysR family regulator